MKPEGEAGADDEIYDRPTVVKEYETIETPTPEADRTGEEGEVDEENEPGAPPAGADG